MNRNLLLTAAALSVLAACGTATAPPAPPLESHAAWVVLPFRNHAQVPQAGERVESMLAALLRAEGLDPLPAGPGEAGGGDALPELDEARRYAAALDWSRRRKARYGMAGAVEEWGYKSGAEGEPAVGLTLSVVDVPTGRVLWTGTGAGTGWGRESASALAQKVLADLLGRLRLDHPG
jgi:hypothetical protein